MKIFRPACGLLRQYLRPFLLVNLVYFGLVGCGMAYGAWDRDTHDALLSSVRTEGPKSLPAVWRAYEGGHVAAAAGLTLAVNLFLGSIAFITVPSFIVPFSGLLLGAVRAVTWGLVFAPAALVWSGANVAYSLLVGLLVLLEGEGYVLAMLAAYVQGKCFVLPSSAQAATRWQGYKIGALRSLQLYPVVAATLAVAAVYETVLKIFIMPLIT